MSTSSHTPVLENILRDLGPQILRGGAPKSLPSRKSEAFSSLSTGLQKLDKLLQGGIPTGCISEFFGVHSSGRTSFAFHLLADALRRGHAVALVDAANAFAPESAAAFDVELARLLWVRAPHIKEALRSTEILLKAPGFGLVLLDLALVAEHPSELHTLPRAVWLRLRRAAQSSGTALLLLSKEQLAGSQASVAVALRGATLFRTQAPALLDGLEIEFCCLRAPATTPHRSVTLPLPHLHKGA